MSSQGEVAHSPCLGKRLVSSCSLSTDASVWSSRASDSEADESPGASESSFACLEELRVRNTFLEFSFDQLSLRDGRRTRSAPGSVILDGSDDVACLRDAVEDTEGRPGQALQIAGPSEAVRLDGAEGPAGAVAAAPVHRVAPERARPGETLLLSTPAPGPPVLPLSSASPGLEGEAMLAGWDATPCSDVAGPSFGFDASARAAPPAYPGAGRGGAGAPGAPCALVVAAVCISVPAPAVAQQPQRVLRLADALAGPEVPGSPGAEPAPPAPRATLRLSGRLNPSEPPTEGSRGHSAGECKPCAHAWKAGGCESGKACQFCHLCTPWEKRRRTKERRAERRAQARAVLPVSASPSKDRRSP